MQSMCMDKMLQCLTIVWSMWGICMYPLSRNTTCSDSKNMKSVILKWCVVQISWARKLSMQKFTNLPRNRIPGEKCRIPVGTIQVNKLLGAIEQIQIVHEAVWHGDAKYNKAQKFVTCSTTSQAYCRTSENNRAISLSISEVSKQKSFYQLVL
jgi:hypothetical protein